MTGFQNIDYLWMVYLIKNIFFWFPAVNSCPAVAELDLQISFKNPILTCEYQLKPLPIKIKRDT